MFLHKFKLLFNNFVASKQIDCFNIARPHFYNAFIALDINHISVAKLSA